MAQDAMIGVTSCKSWFFVEEEWSVEALWGRIKWQLSLFGFRRHRISVFTHYEFCYFHGLLLSLCTGLFNAFGVFLGGSGVGLLACF